MNAYFPHMPYPLASGSAPDIDCRWHGQGVGGCPDNRCRHDGIVGADPCPAVGPLASSQSGTHLSWSTTGIKWVNFWQEGKADDS